MTFEYKIYQTSASSFGSKFRIDGGEWLRGQGFILGEGETKEDAIIFIMDFLHRRKDRAVEEKNYPVTLMEGFL